MGHSCIHKVYLRFYLLYLPDLIEYHFAGLANATKEYSIQYVVMIMSPVVYTSRLNMSLRRKIHPPPHFTTLNPGSNDISTL